MPAEGACRLAVATGSAAAKASDVCGFAAASEALSNALNRSSEYNSRLSTHSLIALVEKLLAKIAGIATKSPPTVVSNALEMPGAMAAMSGRPPPWTMPVKVAMTPHTVPNNPSMGPGR